MQKKKIDSNLKVFIILSEVLDYKNKDKYDKLV